MEGHLVMSRKERERLKVFARVKRQELPSRKPCNFRYEWLGQGQNPITFVRQSSGRLRTPEILEPFEVDRLLSRLQSPYRLMVLLAVTTGLRRSELFALKWRDFDFSALSLHIRRSIYKRTVGQARPTDKRAAQQRLVQMIFPEELNREPMTAPILSNQIGDSNG